MSLIASPAWTFVNGERLIAKGSHWHGPSDLECFFFLARGSQTSALAPDAEEGLLDFYVSLALVWALLESLSLRASGARLLEVLERDLVLAYSPTGPSAPNSPIHTQESSRRFLPRNDAWPSPAVKMVDFLHQSLAREF